jgi:dUTP pyrophosphatase
MLLVKKLDERAIVPTVNNPGEDLGFDLYALEDAYVCSKITTPTKVKTGIAARFVDYHNDRLGGFFAWDGEGELPVNQPLERERYGLLIRDRSSMASKGITVSGGVVDAGYHGELMVLLTNNTPSHFEIKAGDKIAQMIPIPVKTSAQIKVVDKLPDSSRLEKGFGSSGR